MTIYELWNLWYLNALKLSAMVESNERRNALDHEHFVYHEVGKITSPLFASKVNLLNYQLAPMGKAPTWDALGLAIGQDASRSNRIIVPATHKPD